MGVRRWLANVSFSGSGRPCPAVFHRNVAPHLNHPLRAPTHIPAGTLKPHCDLLLCETLATLTEGLAAASAASASGLPWWISWTLEDSERALLRSGEPLQVG